MKTSDQIATLHDGDFLYVTDNRGESLQGEIHEAIKKAVEYDRAQVKKAFIVFTGAYEIWHTYKSAEERIEELLDEGHTTPTVIKVELTEEDETEVLGITARKIADTAKAGEIR